MKKQEVLKRVNPLFLEGIAHRGLHNEEYTENGLKAFQNAIDHHVALELDVHLTTDNQLVVIHDSELKRVTGKEGIVEEKSVKELKDNYRLLDGEKIPTFQEVLSLVHEQVPLVVEMKVYNKNYTPLAARLREEMKNIKDKKNFMIISFDPRALWKMKGTGFVRQLLVAVSHEWTYMFRNTVESLDLEYTMTKEKRVQRYQRKHLVNVWTIETQDQLSFSLPHTDTVTFQKLSVDEVREALHNSKKEA